MIDSRVRGGHGAASLVVLRHFALNLLRRERATESSVATKRFCAVLDEDSLLTVLVGLDE